MRNPFAGLGPRDYLVALGLMLLADAIVTGLVALIYVIAAGAKAGACHG